MLGLAFTEAHRSQEIVVKLRQQVNRRAQGAHAAAAAASGVALSTQEPTRSHSSFSYGGPPVTTNTWSNAANAVLYHHDHHKQQGQQQGCISSMGSVSSLSTNSGAGGGGHRRTRRRRRTKKNVEGEGSTSFAIGASNRSKSAMIPSFVKGTNRHASAASTAILSASSSCSAATLPLTVSTAHQSSPGTWAPCPRKQHDAPMTKRDLYFSLRCGMVGIGHAPQGAAAETAVTEQHSAVGRVTIVNWENQVVFDTLVRVPVPVTDYRTHCTEIPAAYDLSIKNKTALPLEMVRAQVAAILKGKILIGHGLEVDLAALGLSHPWCDARDTATYPPYMKRIVTDPTMTAMMLPRDLQDLLYHFLGRQLSGSSTGQHEPQPSTLVMEAIGCLDLYKIKRHEWEAELILLLRQKERQRQVMLDMRISATTGTQLTSITEDNTLAELSSTDGTAITVASSCDGGRFMTQYELLQLQAQQQYKEKENSGQHSPPLTHYSSFEKPTNVWESYEDSSTMASTMGASTLASAYASHNNSAACASWTNTTNNEDDVSADVASAIPSYCSCSRDHSEKSRGAKTSNPPRFVYERPHQQDTPTRAAPSNITTWKTCSVSIVDFEGNLDDSWLLNSEHGSGVVTLGGGDACHNIWSPIAPTTTTTAATTSSSSVSSLSPIPPSSTTSPKSNAPTDWSHANVAPTGSASRQEQEQQRQAQVLHAAAVSATPNSFLSEEQVMEHLVANLLDFDGDDDDDVYSA